SDVCSSDLFPAAVGSAFNRINRLRQSFFTTRQIDPCRIPDKSFRSCPRHITCLVAYKMPGEVCFCRMVSRTVQFVCADNRNGFITVARLLQTVPYSRSE